MLSLHFSPVAVSPAPHGWITTFCGCLTDLSLSQLEGGLFLSNPRPNPIFAQAVRPQYSGGFVSLLDLPEISQLGVLLQKGQANTVVTLASGRLTKTG